MLKNIVESDMPKMKGLRNKER